MSQTAALQTSPTIHAATTLSWRSIAVTTVVYVAAAAFSYIDSRLAIGLCILVFAETARRDPNLSLFLLLFALPFDRIFYLGEANQIVLLAAQIALHVMSLVLHRRPDPFELLRSEYWARDLRYTAWPLLAAYVALSAVHISSGVDWNFHLKVMVFGGAMLLLVAIYDGRMEPLAMKAAVRGVIVGALFQIAFDMIFLRVTRAVLLPPETLSFDPVVNERLMGLTISSNDLAEFLLCAFCFVIVPFVLGHRRRRAINFLLATTLFAGVALALSKGAFLATGIVLAAAVISCLLLARWNFAFRVCATGVLCVTLVAATVIGTIVMPAIGSGIRAFTQPAMVVYAATTPRTSLVPEGAIQRRLRLGVVTEQSSDLDGKNRIQVGSITCELSCTGHREELWAAGLDVVRRHWLLGVGFGGWRLEMYSLLGFSYSSPHNATLHLWGMFGLLGLVLNLSLYGLVILRTYQLRSLIGRESSDVALAVASTAFILIVMAHEATDTSMIFSLSRFGLFAWLTLAIQSSAIRRARESDLAADQ